MIVSHDQPDDVDVSLCVVNWNNRRLLAELLESIKQENSAAAVETIVIDNASTDGAAEMTRLQYPWAKVVANQENIGFAKANNQAAALARGRHLFFLNNDTRVLPGAIGTLARYLDEHPHVCVAGPKTFLGDGTYHNSCRTLPTWSAMLHRLTLFRWTGFFWRGNRRYLKAGLDPDAIQPVPQMDGAALMIRRTALAAVGGWDEGFTFGLEDVDLCARLAKVGAIMYVPTAAIIHYGSVSQIANRDYARKNFEYGWVRYLAKHHGRLAAPFYKLCVTLDQSTHAFHLLAYAVKWCDYKRRGRGDLLEKHRRWIHAQVGFVFDLPRYWRATGPRPTDHAPINSPGASASPPVPATSASPGFAMPSPDRPRSAS